MHPGVTPEFQLRMALTPGSLQQARIAFRHVRFFMGEKNSFPRTRGDGPAFTWSSAEDPGLVNPANLAPDESVRHEAVMAAHRSALDGDFKPGIALGIFPESAGKPSKSP